MRRDDWRYPVRRDQEWGLSPWSERSDWGSPWQMMRRMQEDMDRLVGQFFGGNPWGQEWMPGAMGQQGGQQAIQQWAPSVDVSQTEREWCIEADLPGVKKDDIDVQVRDNHLILSAQMKGEESPQAGSEAQRQYQRRERRFGFFQRVIPLPANVDEEAIRCEFRDGVLSVHIPRPAEAQMKARRIPVSDAAGGAAQSLQAGSAQGSAPGHGAPPNQGETPRGEKSPGGTGLWGTAQSAGTAAAGAATGSMHSPQDTDRTSHTEEMDEPAMAGAKGGETGRGEGGNSETGSGKKSASRSQSRKTSSGGSS